MIQSPDYHTDDSGILVSTDTEHRGAPLVMVIRHLVERLGVPLRSMQRSACCLTGPDHLMLPRSATSTGSETIQSGLGTERIPHATTTGDFLARFGEDRNAVASELREVGEDLQQQSFAMLRGCDVRSHRPGLVDS